MVQFEPPVVFVDNIKQIDEMTEHVEDHNIDSLVLNHSHKELIFIDQTKSGKKDRIR